MPSRSKAVNSASMLRCEFSVADHASAQSWNRKMGGSLVRRSFSVSPVVAIGLFGVLASAPALAQLPPQTTLRVAITRVGSELIAAPDGGSLDLITFGGAATYNVTVQNIGPSRAYSVSVSGVVPTGPTPTRITAVTPAGCTVATDGSSFTCANIGDLPDGVLADGGFLAATSTTGTVRISLAAPPRPYTTNCTLPDGGPVDGNSLGALSVTANATNATAPATGTYGGTTTTRPLADVAVTVSGPDTASEGSQVSYQVHAANNGPCPANRVRLSNDNVSAGLLFQNNTGNAGCSTYPCILATSWPAGASTDITSTYTVDNLPVAIKVSQELQELDIASLATAGGALATPDPVAANNSAILSTTVSHDTGCSSVGAGSLGFVGIALAAVALIRRRRRA